MKYLLAGFCMVLILAAPSWSKTLIIEGNLSSEIEIVQQVKFDVDKETHELTYRIPLPVDYRSLNVQQQISDLRLSFYPNPETVIEEADSFGNHFKVVTWKNLSRDVRVNIHFIACIDTKLTRQEIRMFFPFMSVPEEMKLYLKPTELVQSADKSIIAQAQKLASSKKNQHAVVDAIFNFVTDHIRYGTSPKSYDALEGLLTGRGNCQNYAHLAVALLRASGIPARVAVGMTLKDKWKIPAGDGVSIVQSMGEGFHAWVEVWFPDLGWLSYDPQQSKQFTSTRHIKYAHALECKNLSPSWIALPGHPNYESIISANYRRDRINIRLKNAGNEPRGYLASSDMIFIPVKLPPLSHPPPNLATSLESPVKYKPEPLKAGGIEKQELMPRPVIPQGMPGRKSLVVIGNTDLPDPIKSYATHGNFGNDTMEPETAEYITSLHIFAQAFQVAQPVSLEKVSLPMHKFGGDGTVYMDVVMDENGKPGFTGYRSLPVHLDRLSRLPGYQWIDFTFSKESHHLCPGKYWIVLRHSGEAVMTWFYTPGQQSSGPEGTRSTSQGWNWEDILTYEFAYRISGLAIHQDQYDSIKIKN